MDGKREESAAKGVNGQSFGQTLFEFKVFSFTQKSGQILDNLKFVQIRITSLTFKWKYWAISLIQKVTTAWEIVRTRCIGKI